MNVTLPENKISKKQIILYLVIAIICIISIIIAFYVQFYGRIDIGKMMGIESELIYGKKSEEEAENLEMNFDQLFTNSIEGENDLSNSKKKDAEKPIVYTKIAKKETKVNNFDVEIYIPYINIDNEIADEYNKEIETFIQKAREILNTENNNAIYLVEYVATIQNDILSVMIKSNLKEGSSAQRLIIETFNYDLRNNKKITLEELLKVERLNINDVQTKINDEIKTEQKRVEDLEKLGYSRYNRDVTSNMYKIENTNVFYMSKDAIYILYPYGNENLTNDLDMIIL